MALYLPKKAGDPKFLYYINVLLCVNKKKVINVLQPIFFIFRTEKCMFEQNEKTCLSQGNAHQWFSVC